MAIAPHIHINGSDPDWLLKRYQTLKTSLMVARMHLDEVAPHMRDFYPLPDADDQFQQARLEHMARIGMLVSCMDQIEDIMMQLTDQMVDRKKGK